MILRRSKQSRTVGKLIQFLGGASLFCLASVVMAQESLAPLNPDFFEYAQRVQTFGVQETTTGGYRVGFIPPPLDLSHLTGQPVFQARESVAAPSSYDLRPLGKVTPVRDQGNCGDCWAFSTYGSLESNLLPSETWDFSENNLKNTSGFDGGPCSGGNGFMSMAYLSRWSGPVTEAQDPYNPYSSISPSGLTPSKHLQEVLIIPDRANALDNDTLKQAVVTYGALMSYMYYDPGFYNPAYNAFYYSGTASPNHGVTIVGWDDNFDRNKFSTVPPGNGAFIIKNSWGTGWGQGGYFYISYYDTKIGKSNFMFNGTDPVIDYNRVYQYDPLGWVNSMGFGTNTAWFSNIFTASSSELLSAVSFFTASPNSSFEISVYNNVASGPTSGTLAGTTAGTIPFPGYHTLPLDAPVSLASGQKFSVVIKLTTPGYNYPIPVEMPVSGYSSQATAQAGQSYISNDGAGWTDLTVSYSNTNVCLKAFTTSTTVRQPNLTPYQPAGWSDRIVVSKVPGTMTDGVPLYDTDILYIDWAVINSGSAATSAGFYTELDVDGVLVHQGYTDPPLNPGSWVFVSDYSIGSLSAGTHVIRMVADSTGVVNESDEGDNAYTKTIVVASGHTSLSIPIMGSGSVTKNPDKPSYTQGEQVTLTAIPGSGYSFASWSGDASGNTNPLIILMNGNKTITANFIHETVTAPVTPSGPAAGIKAITYTYSTGGASSSVGNNVEYQFDWKGDGSDLSAYGPSSQSKAWTAAGTYVVRVRARDALNTSIASEWSAGLSVAISPNVSVTPTTYDFGNVKVRRFKTGSFSIKNSGKTTVSVSASMEGEDSSMFVITSGRGTRKIRPGMTWTIRLFFRPVATGSKTSSLRINTDDPDVPYVLIPLTGAGQ